jgi:hypothetical protein
LKKSISADTTIRQPLLAHYGLKLLKTIIWIIYEGFLLISRKVQVNQNFWKWKLVICILLLKVIPIKAKFSNSDTLGHCLVKLVLDVEFLRKLYLSCENRFNLNFIERVLHFTWRSGSLLRNYNGCTGILAIVIFLFMSNVGIEETILRSIKWIKMKVFKLDI